MYVCMYRDRDIRDITFKTTHYEKYINAKYIVQYKINPFI